ncbi:MAG: hypothetical protein GC164_11875 [Phycisphaera sp.]|nr:hypothetical protein [Phycisphaera sp.]
MCECLVVGVFALSLWTWWQRPTINAGLSPEAITYRIDINTADPGALRLLPGVGKTLVPRIIEYRDTHGPFQSLDDLDKVPGIGPSIVERACPWATVSGL